jgi:hypothetical protein
MSDRIEPAGTDTILGGHADSPLSHHEATMRMFQQEAAKLTREGGRASDMTLRQFYAGMAFAMVAARLGRDKPRTIATICFELADAMIYQSKKES